jgi:hypothetical protein
VANLLAGMGVRGHFALIPLTGGANNKVYRVQAGNTESVLKRYFRHPNDTRDRLRAEFSFVTFAWNAGLRTVPRPLACSFRHGLALYEYVEGRRLNAGEISGDRVAEAMAFYINLNDRRHSADARALPRASEAWGSMVEHLTCVDRRIERLAAVTGSSALDREVRTFIRRHLTERWDAVREQVPRNAPPLRRELGRDEWRLSPSDFGFHNAILAPDGHLRFIDFEYAGWDDPARMICDFLCQQQVPVPSEQRGFARQRVATTVEDSQGYHDRVEVLLPVYMIKWCCILLNDFLPEGDARRRFAETVKDQDERKAEQLRKARTMLARVTV